MKKIEAHSNLKQNIWDVFCSNNYSVMTDSDFVSLVLRKVEKIYTGDYDAYLQIKEVKSLNPARQLRIFQATVDNHLSSVNKILHSFKSSIQKRKLEIQYREISSKLEDLAITIWKYSLTLEKENFQLMYN